MESTIRVYETPKNMAKAFNDNTPLFSIRLFSIIGEPPSPELSDEEWIKKHGDDEFLFKVVVRYSEVVSFMGKDKEITSHLTEARPYYSWANVEKSLKRREKKALSELKKDFFEDLSK